MNNNKLMAAILFMALIVVFLAAAYVLISDFGEPVKINKECLGM